MSGMKHHTRVDPREWPCKYFKPAEIACRGTGMILLTNESRDALQRLDALREAMGHPLIVTSGFRTEQHNKNVGGARASKHMHGIAFDISMANVDPHLFEAEARKAGFVSFGIYPPQKPTGSKNFIHIDTALRDGKPWRGAKWGEFPKRPLTRFAPEPVPTPVRDAVQTASPFAGAVGAVAVAAQELDAPLRELAPWLPERWQAMAFAAIAGLGIWLAVHRVLNRRNKGE
jgi:zinc D-Ala-D-Ala carboxypeptidase